MSKSTPINQVLNKTTTLVDNILNDNVSNTESETIEERQKRDQKQMEEEMKRQIIDQKQNEEIYNVHAEHAEETDEYAKETDEYAKETDEYAEETDEYAKETDEHPEETDEHPEETDEPQNTNHFNKSSIHNSERVIDSVKEKGLLELLSDNIKPTLIVMVITLCVLSNTSTQFIDKLLPNKEIFIKYNIISVLILKSLISGSVFCISNLLL